MSKRRNGNPDGSESIHQRVSSAIAECVQLMPASVKQALAEMKYQSRHQLVRLLDHLDALSEHERQAVQIAMHQVFRDVMESFQQRVIEKLPKPLDRMPRTDAYVAGRTDRVFQNSFFQ